VLVLGWATTRESTVLNPFAHFFFFAALRSLLLGTLFVLHQKPAQPLQPMLLVGQAFHPFFANGQLCSFVLPTFFERTFFHQQ